MVTCVPLIAVTFTYCTCVRFGRPGAAPSIENALMD